MMTEWKERRRCQIERQTRLLGDAIAMYHRNGCTELAARAARRRLDLYVELYRLRYDVQPDWAPPSRSPAGLPGALRRV
jgi:hypothetical protein